MTIDPRAPVAFPVPGRPRAAPARTARAARVARIARPGCARALAALAFGCAGLAPAGPASAQDAAPPAPAAAPAPDVATVDGDAGEAGGTAAVPDLDAVRARIEANLPGMRAASVDATPVPGLFEAVIDGQIYYVDASGDYLFDGSLVHLATRENLTEKRLGTLHMAALSDIDAADMLTYTPDEPTGRSVTIFTDISCGYCRKLHADLDVLLDAGIAVHYLLFPRAGLGSEGAAALESVWCNADPQAAMTAAKSGASVPEATCDNPIAEHVALAQQVGLRGTPLIYTDAGERIPGYREPAAIVDMIEASEPWVAP